MILVTGFEPFGGEASNPSWDAVEMLPPEIAGHAIVKRRLPVAYDRCFDPIRETIGPRVQAVVCVGQAGGRTAITPECAALARMHAALADGDGLVRTHAPIEGGQAAYFATLPVEAMVARLRAQGIPAAASYHAGTYVCNAVLYHLLRALEGTGVLGGFIHVPYASEQVAGRENPPASLPLATIAEGIRLCVEETALACGVPL